MTEPEVRRPSRFLVKPVPILLGLFAGLGVGLFQQQAGWLALTSIWTLVLFILAGAIVFGILVPTLILNVMMMRKKEESA